MVGKIYEEKGYRKSVQLLRYLCKIWMGQNRPECCEKVKTRANAYKLKINQEKFFSWFKKINSI